MLITQIRIIRLLHNYYVIMIAQNMKKVGSIILTILSSPRYEVPILSTQPICCCCVRDTLQSDQASEQ